MIVIMEGLFLIGLGKLPMNFQRQFKKNLKTIILIQISTFFYFHFSKDAVNGVGRIP